MDERADFVSFKPLRRRLVQKELDMRPRFWYCHFCGYMFMDTGDAEASERRIGDTFEESCPMCGEEATPCWECISAGVFDESWCDTCENKPVCWATFKKNRSN